MIDNKNNILKISFYIYFLINQKQSCIFLIWLEIYNNITISIAMLIILYTMCWLRGSWRTNQENNPNRAYKVQYVCSGEKLLTYNEPI